jgi:hypothetical protein
MLIVRFVNISSADTITAEITISLGFARTLQMIRHVCSCEASVLPGIKGTLLQNYNFLAACSIPTLPPKTVNLQLKLVYHQFCAVELFLDVLKCSYYFL